MLKRLIILILILLPALAPARAAVATGSWRSFPVSGEFSSVLESDRNVWYVTGGRLNSYDKEADETRTYEYGRDLSDFTISQLFFNHERHYLVVVYANSNIDLIYEDDGAIMNLPDIKDATINVEKGVNDVAFHGDDIYVATDFGLVLFDETRHEVKESGIYNGHGILYMAAIDGGIVMVASGYGDDVSHILFHPYGTRIHKLDNFTVIRDAMSGLISELTPVGGRALACLRWGQVCILTMTEDYADMALRGVLSISGVWIESLEPATEGGIYALSSAGKIFYADAAGTLSQTSWQLPDAIKNDVITTRRGPDKELWAGSDEGLGQYRLSADGTLTVLREKSLPAESTTFSGICRIYPASDGFIISNLGQNQYHPVGAGDNHGTRLNANIYTGGEFVNINPVGVTAVTSAALQQQRLQGEYIFSPTWMCQDPVNPARFYVSSALEGVYVIEDNKEVVKFDDSNSLISNSWVFVTPFVDFDHQGNLWVTTWCTAGNAPISMLPAEKLRGDLTKIKPSDWVAVNFGGNINNKDAHLFFCRRSNIIFAYDWNGSYAFEVLQHNGTISDVLGHRHVGQSSVTDSDGKTFSPDHWICAVEDKRGHVWFGTSSGVVSVPNPVTAMEGSFTVNRIKVPRRDGTNLADYLLESDKILCMAVDHSNRKWIGTEGSGLYLVSEDGDEILAVYNTSNSPLPVNTITGLHVDPASNSVYVATLSGLFELSTTSGPAAEDYSDVYAYPNPVTPEYTGWITITGLMDSSMVKIVDADMHLVYQTTSEGGMAMWDGCNMNGSRVRSGVYYVIASSGSETSSQGAVATKILVVN